jgi:hypothetical protein
MAIRRKAAKGTKPERSGLGGGSVDEFLKRGKKKKDIWVNIGDGNTVTVHAVDTRKYFKDGPIHVVEFEREDGSTYTMDRRCLDVQDDGEPCPGCRDNLERRYKFWMIVIERGEKRDRIGMLTGAKKLVTELNRTHKLVGLDNHDIEISQTGTKFEVQYDVEISDDDVGRLTAEDKELVEAADNVIESFKFFTSIPDFDSYYDPPSSSNDDEDDEEVAEKSRKRGSALAGKRKKPSDRLRPTEEEDEDEGEDHPQRRSSKNRKPGGIAGMSKQRRRR